MAHGSLAITASHIMTTRRVVFSVMFMVAFVATSYAFVQVRSSVSNIVTEPSPDESLPVIFWDKKIFYDSLAEVRGVKNDDGRIIGGIVPHHTLAGTLIADLFARLAAQPPRTIILIGPNHYEVGYAHVISSRKDWHTPFGTVAARRDVLDSLRDANLVAFDDAVMQAEHSTQVALPYMAHFIPQATVIPLVISNFITAGEMDALVRALEPIVREGAVVVASVDFSHHLNAAQALQRDEITIRALQAGDRARLLHMSSEHLDSPTSIVILMMLMERVGHDAITIDRHTNSGVILGDNSQQVTSYLTASFR